MIIDTSRRRFALAFSYRARQQGLFSTPWEVTAEGLHLVVRTLGESELGKPPDDPSRRAATSPGVSPTADTPQMGTSATSSSSASTGGAGPQLPTNAIEDASFWEKCFPCLQALENLKLTLRDLTLDIYDGQDPDAGQYPTACLAQWC